MSLHMVLYEPRIPPNTGAIARLCAATCTHLHLIEPLGFSLEDRYLKRAGLDYWPYVTKSVWPDFATFVEQAAPGRIVPTSARRGVVYHEYGFRPGDALVLGPETTGLSESFYERWGDPVRIPIWGQVRSINLACAAAVLLYDAIRQTDSWGEG